MLIVKEWQTSLSPLHDCQMRDNRKYVKGGKYRKYIPRGYRAMPLPGTYKTQELPCHCGPGPHMFKVYSR